MSQPQPQPQQMKIDFSKWSQDLQAIMMTAEINMKGFNAATANAIVEGSRQLMDQRNRVMLENEQLKSKLRKYEQPEEQGQCEATGKTPEPKPAKTVEPAKKPATVPKKPARKRAQKKSGK